MIYDIWCIKINVVKDMGIIRDNKLLFDEYLKTKDAQLIHKILINSEASIKQCISTILKSYNRDENLVDEYFSAVYLGVYNKLTKSLEFKINDEIEFYYYIRRRVYKIVKRLIREDKSIEENVTYNGLLNNELFSDDFNEEEFINQLEKKEIFKQCIETLDPLRKQALTLRFGLNGTRPMGLEEIACEMNLSHQRVSILIITSMNSLKTLITRADINNVIINKKR